MGIRDKLMSGKVVGLLNDLGQINSQIKASQTRGSDSVTTYRVSLSPGYTFTNANYENRLLQIEFIPDQTKFGGTMCFSMNPIIQNGSNYNADPGNVIRQPITDGRQLWRFRVVPYGTTIIHFYAYAQGTGTIVVNLLQ